MHCTTSRSPRAVFHTTSPLYAGLTPHYEQRALDIFLDNLARYVAGEPLGDVVGKDLVY
jgi:hypothetical protein